MQGAAFDIVFPAPLIVAVIADTHCYDGGARRLSPEVPTLFRRWGVGLILHAGDVGGWMVVRQLEEVAPVIAVRGNNEAADLNESLPLIVRLQIGPFRVIVTHGLEGRTARLAAKRHAPMADCIVYGHSHIPKIESEQGAILFNPGSPTDRRWGPHYGVGRLVVGMERIEPELVLFVDPAHLRQVT